MDNLRRSSGGTPKSSAQLGNLTGPARVLNDIVVSFHNCIQKWNDAYLNGVRLIQSVQANNGNEDQFQASCEKLGSLVDVLAPDYSNAQLLCQAKQFESVKRHIIKDEDWSFMDVREFW